MFASVLQRAWDEIKSNTYIDIYAATEGTQSPNLQPTPHNPYPFHPNNNGA